MGVATSTTPVTIAAVDFVEVFADVTRWLEYDVLKTEYGETALSQLWMVGNQLSAINPFQLPIGRYIQGTLSGGVEGCVGSSKFDACMQTFIDTNSPGPTAEAQLRALVTNLYAVYIRLQDIAGDTTTDDMSALIRAWTVSLASFIANM